MTKLSSFRDLDVWKRSHQLVLFVYKETSMFPSSEQFGLTNQLRRASVSITSNIAEGFARHNFKEKLQFYYVALGSLTEVSSQIEIAKDIGYTNLNKYDELYGLCNEVGRLLRSLIRSTQAKIIEGNNK